MNSPFTVWTAFSTELPTHNAGIEKRTWRYLKGATQP